MVPLGPYSRSKDPELDYGHCRSIGTGDGALYPDFKAQSLASVWERLTIGAHYRWYFLDRLQGLCTREVRRPEERPVPDGCGAAPLRSVRPRLPPLLTGLLSR